MFSHGGTICSKTTLLLAESRVACKGTARYMVLAPIEQVERLIYCVGSDTIIKSVNVTLRCFCSRQKEFPTFVCLVSRKCMSTCCHSPVSLHPETKAALCDVTVATDALPLVGCLAHLLISTGFHLDKSEAPVALG